MPVNLARPALAPLLLLLPALAACGGGSASTGTPAPPAISAASAEARLAALVLDTSDLAPGYTQDVARPRTNDEAANARPDTENARTQYADWGQVLAFNVQYGPPKTAGLVYSGVAARIMNTATLYQSADGASAALAYERGLSPSVVANFLVNDGAGTKISDTQAVKDIDFPAKGDESFAWRVSGKATFADGFTVNFVADAVYVRVGRVTGNVTAVALGQAPDRAALVALVNKFIARVKAAAV